MFEKFKFQQKQINIYFRSATHSFKIASDSNVPEVVFKFCYDALIKLAIAVCAKNSLRVKARPGHHIELLRKLAEFLEKEDIEAVGNEMRKKRNLDLYAGGILVSKKEAGEYKGWLKTVLEQAEEYLYGKRRLF